MEYFSASDRRLKENIVPTRFGLADLLKIRVRDYNYKTDPRPELQTGFIAQELYEAYPPAVGVGGADVETDPWEVAYGSLTPLLVQAVQDQQEIIKTQEEQLKTQEEQLKTQEQRIAELEAQNAQVQADLQAIRAALSLPAAELKAGE